jgi:hypothetical protein
MLTIVSRQLVSTILRISNTLVNWQQLLASIDDYILDHICKIIS